MWSLFYGSSEQTSDEDDKEVKEQNLAALHTTQIPGVSSKTSNATMKHRLPSPAREQGDGMESPKETVKTETNVITLPQTNIKLDKLPPITADKEVKLPAPTPTSPLVKMTVTPPKPTLRHSNSASSLSKSKEPKFVPYEPYKAAVTDFVSRKKKSRANRQSSVKTSKPEKIRGKAVVVVDSKQYPEEEKLLTNLLDESNQKVRELEEKLAESEKQLTIQMKVNCEVKKLLVASVGEDIEARVDYLTQDKARLAADIRQYSNIMNRDFEEKEKLSVESDLWKSKFLACSLIVDELARSKALLSQKCESYEHHVRLLLHERSMLWGTLDDGLESLERLSSAFNPLSVTDTSGSFSVLGLADSISKTSAELNERLLGRGKAQPQPSSEVNKEKMDTPAEEGLKELLETKLDENECSNHASAAITGKARPYLAKMNDKLAAPGANSSLFKCCTHCQGNVHIV